jgi:hypothetical protein
VAVGAKDTVAAPVWTIVEVVLKDQVQKVMRVSVSTFAGGRPRHVAGQFESLISPTKWNQIMLSRRKVRLWDSYRPGDNLLSETAMSL